jgi:prepilin-type N-terminal cleavage/methylation domain-containing protein
MKSVPSHFNYAVRRPCQKKSEDTRQRVPTGAGFTLVEVLVAMALLSLIVLALMAVFNSTQAAFRAGLTQTDVLEPGRATMDLIRSDLETMTPSLGYSNDAVNFCITNNNYYTAGYSPFYQPLPASINGYSRTNVLESFFILSRGNVNGGDSWIGTGYAVMAFNAQNDLYPLYRFTTNYPIMTTGDPLPLFYNYYTNSLLHPTNGSHLMDGVVHLRLYALDNNGQIMNAFNYPGETNNFAIYQLNPSLAPDEYGVIFYSNKVPASVVVEMGVLEDSTLQHAESLNASYMAQTNYLAHTAGQVHIFSQSVPIRNVDPTAYP